MKAVFVFFLLSCVAAVHVCHGADVLVFGDDGTIKIGTLSSTSSKASVTSAPLSRYPSPLGLGGIPGLFTSLSLSLDGTTVYGVSLFDLGVWSINVGSGAWSVTELWSTIPALKTFLAAKKPDINALPEILLPLAVQADPATSGSVLVIDPLSFAIRRIAQADKSVTTLAGGGVTIGKLISDLPTYGPKVNADGTGTDASFLIPLTITSGPSGDVFVSEIGGIRKVSPAGEVVQFTGQKLDIASIFAQIANLLPDARPDQDVAQDGAGMEAQLAEKMTSDTFPAPMAEALAKAVLHNSVAPSTKTRAAPKDPYFGLGFKDGPKEVARFNIPLVSAGADGTLFVADIMLFDENNDIALGTSRIRVVSPTGVVRTIAGFGKKQSDGTGLAEGTGTSVVFGIVTGITVDANNVVYVMEACPAGSIIRAVDGTTGAVSMVAGDYVTSQCDVDLQVALETAIKSGKKNPLVAILELVLPPGPSVNGGVDANHIRRGVGMVSAQSGCGVLLPSAADFTFDGSCTLGLLSKVPQVTLKKGSRLTVTRDMLVEKAVVLPAGSVFVAKAPVVIKAGISLADDGTLEVDGAPVTANDLTMTAKSVYHIHIDSAVPPKLTLTQGATISGTLVITIGPNFDFPSGASASVMSFGINVDSSSFLDVFIVKLRSRSGSASPRSLLQAAGATAACGATSCVATGTGVAGSDDDDEVPIVVALVIVSVALFAAIALAVFVSAKKRSSVASKSGTRVASAPQMYSDPSSASSNSSDMMPLFQGASYTTSSTYSS